jgi:hypothetical protein
MFLLGGRSGALTGFTRPLTASCLLFQCSMGSRPSQTLPPIASRCCTPTRRYPRCRFFDGPLYAADALAHDIAASAVPAHMQQCAATAQTQCHPCMACALLPPQDDADLLASATARMSGGQIPKARPPCAVLCSCCAVAKQPLLPGHRTEVLVWHSGLRGRQGAECCRQGRAAVCADHRATAHSGWVTDGCRFWCA